MKNLQNSMAEIKQSNMNKRIRKYSPVLYSPQHSSLSILSTSPMHNHWKEYLSQEVEDYYQQLMRNKNSTSTALTPQRSAMTLHSPETSFFGKSQTKTNYSKPMTTSWKEGNLRIHNYQSLQSTASKPVHIATSRHSDYHIQLIKEECSFLRDEFIKHCDRKHPREFQK